MSDPSNEQVLVIPTERFRALGYFQGFSHAHDRYLRELLDGTQTSYLPRAAAEDDPRFKQLIPYLIFRHRDVQAHTLLFQYTRSPKNFEARLHRKRSIGVGGHIALDDGLAETGSPYDAAMRRELAEELEIDTPFVVRCAGLINDDSTSVGRVHLGIVHIADVERPSIEARDGELLEGGFSPVESILADLTAFESWSQICLRALFS